MILAEQPTIESNSPSFFGALRYRTFGEVRGRVTDAEGAPLDGAIVSALGTARVAVAACDAEGRFDLRSLPAGQDLLVCERHCSRD